MTPPAGLLPTKAGLGAVPPPCVALTHCRAQTRLRVHNRGRDTSGRAHSSHSHGIHFGPWSLETSRWRGRACGERGRLHQCRAHLRHFAGIRSRQPGNVTRRTWRRCGPECRVCCPSVAITRTREDSAEMYALAAEAEKLLWIVGAKGVDLYD